jgi:8-amino-7-oxononanoate synthase
MLDFTSALYLGLEHASVDLPPWRRLSTGRPASLAEAPGAAALGQGLAQLVGCAAGTLLPSTWHLFWDLLGVLNRQQPIEIFMDAATYPIARWGAEHWAGQGVPLHRFGSHDAAALERLLARRPRTSLARWPVVLSDALNPGGTSQPPLCDYAELARRHRGWLLLDDTQALGVLGARPTAQSPYGEGGGGSLPHFGLQGAPVLLGASLAKGYGVPLALLAGPQDLLQSFDADSASREHMSPPSQAVIHAGQAALRINRQGGEALRRRLWQRVRHLRAGLSQLGLATRCGDFPVQPLALPPGCDVPGLHGRLMGAGLATVAQRGRGAGARISLLVTARHSPCDIDRALHILARTRAATNPSTRRETCTG